MHEFENLSLEKDNYWIITVVVQYYYKPCCFGVLIHINIVGDNNELFVQQICPQLLDEEEPQLLDVDSQEVHEFRKLQRGEDIKVQARLVVHVRQGLVEQITDKYRFCVVLGATTRSYGRPVEWFQLCSHNQINLSCMRNLLSELRLVSMCLDLIGSNLCT